MAGLGDHTKPKFKPSSAVIRIGGKDLACSLCFNSLSDGRSSGCTKSNVYFSHPDFFLTVDESLRGSGSLPTPGCISRSGMEFDTWMKASSAQSIKPSGWPVPNWNTMNTGERMFFLFVYLDASVEQYLFGFKLDMESIINRDFQLI